MRTAPTVTRLPRPTSHAARYPRLGVPFRGPRFRHAAWSAVTALFIASAGGCGHETAAPESDELLLSAGASLFELDSVQLTAAFSGKAKLPSGAVNWSVSGGGLATMSATGLLTAIHATDFDRPADSVGSRTTVTATVGTRSASRTMWLLGWQKPRAPGLDGVAYMSTGWSAPDKMFGGFISGIDQAGEPFGWWGSLVLTCGTVAAGKWTVEISPDDLDAPTMATNRKLFSTDTVSVAFDSEVLRFELWQRVGLRLRAADGDDMVRRMRRARTLAVIARSYAADPTTFEFRLGNVERVTQSAAFRACD